ncbi:MAG: hypothetical protein LBQ64_02005 [Bacteroidales bacterium]|jgi:hypothetical protein|nr:hypothetical protein [Bacteroidales bacterium]
MIIDNKKSCFYGLRSIVVFCFLMCISAMSVDAQFYNGYNLTFGKSRIQHAERIWNYYRTPLADIYYYPQSKELAGFASEYISETVLKLEDKLGINLQNKIQIIIYARQSDFMQSNIGYQEDDFYNTGGITPLYGDKLFLYFKGNLNTFLDDLRGGLAGLFVNNFLVGRTVGSNISASYASAFPTWFTDGLSAYLSKEWSHELDNKVKDGVFSGRYKKIHNLSVSEQQTAGFSFWKFVADQYGEGVIPVVLYYAGATRNYERAIYYALRTPFDDLLSEWQAYYHDKYTSQQADEQDTVEASLFKYKKYTDYLYPRISPDGTLLAYVSNREGRVKVWLLNLQDNRKTCIYRFHYRIEDNPDYSYPLLAWHPSGSFLMMMTEYHDKVYLHPYRIDKKKFDDKQVMFIEKITDFSYSSDGRYIALSGVKDGRSDIYLYNVPSRSLEQITNDKADDFAPRFITNNTRLIFSSSRHNDTLGADKGFQQGKYDLFLYDIATKEKQLNRVTHTSSANETYAMEAGKDYVSFLSDNNGVGNRYGGAFKNVISHIDTGIHYTYRVDWYPVSNYNTGILSQDIDPVNGVVAQQLIRNGRQIIGTENHASFSDMKKRELFFPAVASVEEETADSVEQQKTPQKRLRQFRTSDLNIPSSDDTNAVTKEEPAASPGTQPEISLLPRNYEVQYFIGEMVAQADFNFLNMSYQQFVQAQTPIYLNAGLNAFLMIGIRDLMEDFRMTGGVRISIDFNNLEFLYSYENLKRRLDRQIVLHFQSLKSFDGFYNLRQQNINLHYILKYPFDRVNSLHTSFVLRYNRNDIRAVDDYSLQKRPAQSIWIGAKEEYIIDNTRKMAINLMRGFRGKVFAEFSCIPNNDFHNMFVVGMDMRYYARLHNTLVWANRFAASASFGKNRLIYYMGGVDNWIIPKFNREVSIDTSVNYSYQTLATNMRGFIQNIRNGSNFFVLNSELRFQIVQCFVRKPLRSEFLQSLQLVLFGDMGTAWVGLHPYLENNVLFTQTIQSGEAIKITLKKQTEPIVGGFGMGLRFQLFSYFIRLDYAWGVENYKVADKGVFYLSFNLDF